MPYMVGTKSSLVRTHLETALGSDGRHAIVAVRRLLDEDLPWLEERAVRLARADGYNWAQLGRLLHRSRQAVRQRFADIDVDADVDSGSSGSNGLIGLLLPPTRPTTEQHVIGLVRTSRAAERRRREFEAAGPGDLIAW
jgi:hypothetical protein